MLKTVLRSLATTLLLAPLAASADHLRPHLLLAARLNGAQEVPAVNTGAQGVAAITLNATRDTIFIQAAFSGLSGPVTGVHFHDGAVGTSAAVSVNLIGMRRDNRLSGFLTGAEVAPARLAKYLSGGVYLNVHTAANPGGEIRGQVLLETDNAFTGQMSGAQEVPAVATTATGLGIFTLNQSQDKLKFRVTLAGLSAAVTGAHFHIGAVGANGGVAINLLPFLANNVIEGEVTAGTPATPGPLTPAFLTALNQGLVYINVHTSNNPGGEIRAQVFTERRFVALDSRLDGAQMVPAVTTAGKAVAVGRLVGRLDSVYVMVGHSGLSGPPLAIDIYSSGVGLPNTPANLLGSVPVITGPGGNTVGNVTRFAIAAPDLTPAVVNQLLSAGLNVVLTTAANPNGEVRGQVLRLAREGYTISLNGAQERPNPTTSTGYGVGVVSIDRDQSNARFMSVWGGLTGPATGGHFHTGLSSQSGPVVFSLVPFFDNAATPTAAYGYWKDDSSAPFTTRRSLQFRRDSMYMNLHTAAFGGGEIRGQVFRGARNLQRVLATQPALVLAESFGTAPNPFSAVTTLSFEARATGAGQVRVTDMLGRPVATQPVVVRPGANSLSLNLPSVAPGLYLLLLEVGESRLVTRIAKE